MEYTLKVGDLIAQKHGKITGIYKVSRLTRTTAIIDMNGNEVKVKGEVNPNYFRRIGADAWSRESFKLATETDILDFEFIQHRARLAKINWDSVPDQKVKQIIEILNNK